MKIGRILKTDISKVFNPYIPGIAIGGDSHRVLLALDSIYIREGKVFEGSVNDHVELAKRSGIPEKEIRWGFQELHNEHWLVLDGDTFTPGQWLIERYG